MHFVNILRKTHGHDAVSDMLAAPASADTDPGPVMIPSILQKGAYSILKVGSHS